MTIEEAEAFRKLREHLEKTGSDAEIMKAFDTIRNGYTRIVGQLMLLCIKSGPEIEED